MNLLDREALEALLPSGVEGRIETHLFLGLVSNYMGKSTNVAEFFEREADRYARGSTGNAPFHVISARMIEENLAGEVVSIGGPSPRA